MSTENPQASAPANGDAVIDDGGGSSGAPTAAPSASPPAVTSEGGSFREKMVAELAQMRDREAKLAGEKPIEEPKAKAAPTDEEAADDTPADEPALKARPAVESAVDAALARRERENEERQGIRRKAEEQAGKVLADAESRATKMIADAEAKATARVEELLGALRSDPQKALKMAGWDPAEFVMNAAEADTPQGRMRRENLELRARLEKLEGNTTSYIEQQKAAQDEARKAAASREHEQLQTNFLSHVLDETKHPTLASAIRLPRLKQAFFDEAAAYAASVQAETGKPPSWDDVGAHFESVYNPKSGASNGKAPAAPTNGGKGARAPSQGHASEKRSTAHARYEELDPTEARRALIDEARAARRAADQSDR